MLALAMKGLSEEELESVVAEYCSSFGSATVLSVLAPHGQNDHGAAAVRMSSEGEAEELARNVSGARCGTKVIFKLAPHGRHISTITVKNFFRPEGASPSTEDLSLARNRLRAQSSKNTAQEFPHDDRSFWGLALAGD